MPPPHEQPRTQSSAPSDTEHGAFDPTLERLRSLHAKKWTKYEADVIPAWVADQDIAPAPVAIDAMRRVLDRGDLGYNVRAREALPEAFSAWQSASHGWTPDPGEIRLYDDVLHAITHAIWHLTEPGDGIVLFAPIYPPFITAVEASGRRITWCPLDEGTWQLDPSRLAAVIDERTRILLLCNPHNPTGRVFTPTELEGLAQVAVANDLLVISDEVWADLIHPGTVHVPAATVEGLRDRAITVSSASKSFNLAGLRCAVAHVGDPHAREVFDALPPHLIGAVNTLGAEAALACWQEGRPWLEDLKRHLASQRDHLADRLSQDLPMVGYSPPEATYLAWLDFRPLGVGDDPAADLLETARVGLSSGTDFGAMGVGWARLNFATSRQILDEIVDRISQAMANTS